MKFQFRHSHPLTAELAFRRWCDELVERAAELPHVRTLRERERDRSDGRIRRVVECVLDVEVPLVARPFLPRDALVLELAEELDERELACRWRLCSRGLSPQAVRAAGLLLFQGRQLLVEGEALVDPKALPQIPSPLARGAAPTLQRALIRWLEEGYRRLACAVC